MPHPPWITTIMWACHAPTQHQPPHLHQLKQPGELGDGRGLEVCGRVGKVSEQVSRYAHLLINTYFLYLCKTSLSPQYVTNAKVQPNMSPPTCQLAYYNAHMEHPPLHHTSATTTPSNTRMPRQHRNR